MYNLEERYKVKIDIIADELSFAPITRITFTDGNIIDVKTYMFLIVDYPNEYHNSIEEEIKKYNIVLRKKKLERICQ